MRLHSLTASLLAVAVQANHQHLHQRDVLPRAVIAVGPSGVCPVQPDITIIVQPVYNASATSISYVTVTNTATLTQTPPPPVTTTFTPPFTGGQGLPSGPTDNLADFFFLAFSTPAAGPVIKRDYDLERRQAPAQNTAIPVKLVDLSVATPGAPAQAADRCDGATPFNLINGVLNFRQGGQLVSVGKLRGAESAILGSLINPPNDQVNTSFSVNSALLNWNAPDQGAASFFSCAQQIYAGFPALDFDAAACTPVLVAPVAGAVCVSYVTSSRPADPTFTPPVSPTSSTSVTSATVTSTSASTVTDSTSTSTDSTSTSTDSTSSQSSSATTESTSSSSGTSGVQSTTSTITSDVTSVTTSSMTMTTTSAGLDVCLPNPCQLLNGLTGTALTTQLGLCQASLGDILNTNLQVAACIPLTILGTTSGTDIANCISVGLGCPANPSTTATTTSGLIPDLPLCISVLPQTCLNLNGLTTLQLAGQPGLITSCNANLLALLDPSQLTSVTTCLTTNLLAGGSGIVQCLQGTVLCAGSSTTAQPSSTPSPILDLPLCISVLPQTCLNLNGLTTLQLTTNPGLITSCNADLTSLLDLTTLTGVTTCLTNNLLAGGSGLVSCLQGTVLCAGSSTTVQPSATPTPLIPDLPLCISVLPQTCLNLNALTSLQLLGNPGLVTSCNADLESLLNLSVLGSVTTCLTTNLLAGGSGLVQCLQGTVLCTSFTTSAASATTASATTTSTPPLLPSGLPDCLVASAIPPACLNLNGLNVNPADVLNAAGQLLALNTGIAQCLTDLTTSGLGATALNTLTTASCLVPQALGAIQGANILTCVTNAVGCGP
ncbi:uncharacterized protein HMPREF1541_03786 [Cyphellophora europaea CBS 101466]|uniref:Uncharacterized protein n=1 Tax=Cyphellophora europaea (strain CBS 101466) TaxID=1220924 RepID=W2RZG6_CYPE1|nr:uncharacterized protein HMPREF1541_03786 [Cyphellophora europaea CBS 101466]ETN41847.1 hypothetical protein HMPREF1541_03786 [Cyphellophora europaea CBS 101466]